MKVKFISCWFKTSYGAYTDALKTALENTGQVEAGVIASNCGCGDAIEVARDFQDHRSEYFEFPHIYYYKSKNWWKYRLRLAARRVLYHLRARRYMARSNAADVLHFHQTLNAFGSNAAFSWLGLASKAAKVITVHELDSYQTEFPEANRAYNKAHGILVHAAEMKEALVKLGVNEDLVEIVPHGTGLPRIRKSKRGGIIFYAGHKPNSGKGMSNLFRAMQILKEKLGSDAPELKIHGHYGFSAPESGVKLAADMNLADKIVWLNQIYQVEVTRQYQEALLCVLPYTGSFAGYPAVNAMANGLPVIATRCAGLPEHLGDTGIWIDENNPEQLASKIMELIQNSALWEEKALQGRARAEAHFSWDKIADQTLAVYHKALRRHQSIRTNLPRPASQTTFPPSP